MVYNSRVHTIGISVTIISKFDGLNFKISILVLKKQSKYVLKSRLFDIDQTIMRMWGLSINDGLVYK